MAKNLVIVESPAKASTIKQYLGSDFEVLASYGHIRDLPKSVLGIEVDKKYEPKYMIPKDSKKTIDTLKKALKGKELWLATDYDREGEAIAWHLISALEYKKEPKRIVFTEITKPAILKSVKNPRKIDLQLVDAQQARRILDRLVGYSLSPFLWKIIAKGLSAGRVQSVAVRLVVEREEEIGGFKADEYWELLATLEKPKEEPQFNAMFYRIGEKKIDKLEIKNKKQSDKIIKEIEKGKWSVKNVDKKETKRYPSPPFMTSTLQQTASNTLGFSPKRTMRIAQQLYEGIKLSGKNVGLITYMRTDSLNIAPQALKKARNVIKKLYGDKYLPEAARVYKTRKKGAQEAHEAIRPTKPELIPGDMSKHLDRDQLKLYTLIWKRFIASQTKEANVMVVTVDAEVLKYGFIAKDENVIFDGYLKVWDKNIKSKNPIPELKNGDNLNLIKLDGIQKFTKAPARYTEASLIKKLESLEIGRPSTYAPTMGTIIDRGYINKDGAYLVPTDLAKEVTKVLVGKFEDVVDYKFTAHMEKDLDKIADGKMDKVEVLDEFWKPFSKNLEAQKKTIKKSDFQTETGEKCPECKKPLVEKWGKYGKFLACSGFPDCKYSRPLVKSGDKKEEKEVEKKMVDKKCPKCGGKLMLKESRFGQFLACENYPKCKFTESVLNKTGQKCPECGKGDVVVKKTKKGKTFWGCSNYPKCKWASWTKPGENDKKLGDKDEKKDEK